jgi:hypothetical protein
VRDIGSKLTLCCEAHPLSVDRRRKEIGFEFERNMKIDQNFPSCAHVLKFEAYALSQFRISPLQILHYLLQRTGNFALSLDGQTHASCVFR